MAGFIGIPQIIRPEFKWMLILFLCFSKNGSAQELFVYSEPASNMAAKSIGFRAANNFIRNQKSHSYNFLLVPEIMVGVSKKIMVHGAAFVDDVNHNLKATGGEMYLKYRFYSRDEVHSHFRMAAFGRIAHSEDPANQEAIDLYSGASGYEAGIVATKLLNKTAVSSAVSAVHSTSFPGNEKPGYKDRTAFNYNVSVGNLVLPREYINYSQLNVNLMLELLGQTSFSNRESFVDLAPAVQFIIMSRMRIDIGYRFAIEKKLMRLNTSSYLVKLEYNIFNAYN